MSDAAWSGVLPPVRRLGMRIGVGYDSHRFAPGGPMVLGGHLIDSDVHLDGHSDGDAIAHAVTDAILGAAAFGDIGEHFPDTDSQNKDRDSIGMLELAVKAVHDMGWEVGQVDIVVIAEKPKIAPDRQAMRLNISRALGVAITDVSIKGKTNEKMGFVGRGEGLACIATATIWNTRWPAS